jgi:hypothetical protein
MSANDLIGARLSGKVLGSAKGSIATATTTALDFGTPNDIDLANETGYKPGDRILVVADFSTAGTTDTTALLVQDAPDSSGSIGTPAAAVTDGTALTGGTGDQYFVVGVKVQPGRPWLRVAAVRASGTTDTTVFQATVIAVPPVL